MKQLRQTFRMTVVRNGVEALYMVTLRYLTE